MPLFDDAPPTDHAGGGGSRFDPIKVRTRPASRQERYVSGVLLAFGSLALSMCVQQTWAHDFRAPNSGWRLFGMYLVPAVLFALALHQRRARRVIGSVSEEEGDGDGRRGKGSGARRGKGSGADFGGRV